MKLTYFLLGATFMLLLLDVVEAEDKPMYLCTSKQHATIVGRKAEACPTRVTERKAKILLRQSMQKALGMYGKREVKGAVKSYSCRWQ